MNPTYTKRQRLFARLCTILFILSMIFAAITGMSSIAMAIDTDDQPVTNFTIQHTSGSSPDTMSDVYTVATGDTVTFELDITNPIRPQAITIVNTTGMQFQHIDNMLAVDRNNTPIPWEYNNSLPIDNRIEINATGLPDTTSRINIIYTCTVLESGTNMITGLNAQVLYLDNGVTHILRPDDSLFSLNIQIATIDSSHHNNLPVEERNNYLTTGTYGLYYNSEMTRPIRFTNTGDIYQAIPEWDNRGKNYIEIKNTGTANIHGLASGVYYLKQTIPPDNYEDYRDTIELQVYGVKTGETVATRIKILNDADVQLQPIKAHISQNTLTLDYAGYYSTLRKIQTVIAQNTLPILGCMLLAVVGISANIKSAKAKAQR